MRFNYFYDSKHVSDMVALKLPEREFNLGSVEIYTRENKARLRN